MSANTPAGQAPHYYVPASSRHPVMAAIGLFFVILGAGSWINGAHWGSYALLGGLIWFLVVLYQWFRDAVRETRQGLYSHRIDLSFRWSMSWFIFSEVMFFGAFFTALWWARSHSLPNLASLDNAVLWSGFKGQWPTIAGGTAAPAGIIEPFEVMRPLGVAAAEVWEKSFLSGIWQTLMQSLPTVNTALLLTSGVTLTIAHHALIDGKRDRAVRFMWATVLLGLIFLFVQGYEYFHAYHGMNLKLSSGIYGSTFFMLTGFHGFHVFVGMLMLLFITLRLRKGDFNAQNHFGFEGAAWYWHFVDVVWLGLYVLVYWM